MANNADQFIGLSRYTAMDRAEQCNLIFRLATVNGEDYLGYPGNDDVREDRVCVEVVGGTVVSAKIC